MYGEAEIEATERALAAERSRAVAARRKALAEQGAAECIDCGDEIPAARREALPSARRCIGCQTEIERCNTHA